MILSFLSIKTHIQTYSRYPTIRLIFVILSIASQSGRLLTKLRLLRERKGVREGNKIENVSVRKVNDIKGSTTTG